MSAIGEVRYLLLLTLGAFATRLSLFFVSFYNKDEASYSALVARCLEGAIPYAQAVEIHPPGRLRCRLPLQREGDLIAGQFRELEKLKELFGSAVLLQQTNDLRGRGSQRVRQHTDG